MDRDASRRPESDGELLLQEQLGTRERALRFYDEQMIDVLTPRMIEFIGRQTQMIVASADAEGRPDATVRFGEPGFVAVLDERTLCWPELRGNGVMTTLGNFVKNPWAHLMFLDHGERIGLHLRGETVLVDPADLQDAHPELVAPEGAGRPAERWVLFRVATSYIHCRKHFPRTDAPVEWGSDDVRAKGGDYFGAKSVPAPWTRPADGW